MSVLMLSRDTVLSTACFIPFIDDNGRPGSSIVLRMGAFGNLQYNAATRSFTAGSYETDIRETFTDTDLVELDEFVRRYEKPSASGEGSQVLEFERPLLGFRYVRQNTIDIDDQRDFDIKDFCVSGIATRPDDIGPLNALRFAPAQIRGVTLSGSESDPSIESAKAQLVYNSDRDGFDLNFSFSGTLRDDADRVNVENLTIALAYGQEFGAFQGTGKMSDSSGTLSVDANGGLFGPQAREIGFVVTVRRDFGSEAIVLWVLARRPADAG